jgi:hypothetical protein
VYLRKIIEVKGGTVIKDNMEWCVLWYTYTSQKITQFPIAVEYLFLGHSVHCLSRLEHAQARRERGGEMLEGVDCIWLLGREGGG